MPLPPLNEPGSTSTVDSREAAATSAIRRYCGWHVAPVITEELVVDPSGSDVLVLPTLRIVDLISLSVDAVVIDVSTVEWSHKGFLRGWLGTRLRGVVVEIEHGFDAPELGELVRSLAARTEPSRAGLRSTSIGSVSLAYSEPELMEHEKSMLDRYRLPKLSR